MSQEIDLNSMLRAGKRKLTIQTKFDARLRAVKAIVLDEEQVLDVREWNVEEDLSAAQIAAEVRQFHDLTLSDLELLFYVIEKVHAGKSPASLYKLGSLFLEKGFFDEAIESFTALIQIEPDFENGYYSLGQAWFRQGDLAQALANLRQAAAKRPNYPDVHLLLAKVLRKNGEHQMAAESCEKALALNPDYLRAHLMLGLIWAESTLAAAISSGTTTPHRAHEREQAASALCHEPG